MPSNLDQQERTTPTSDELDARFGDDFSAAERARLRRLNEEMEQNGSESDSDNSNEGSGSEASPGDGGGSGTKSSNDDTVGDGYKPSADSSQKSALKQDMGQLLKGRSRKGFWASGLVVTSILGLIVGGGSFFNFFKLHSVMRAVEERGFGRYQVSMDGRSSKWLQAYFLARTFEVAGSKNIHGDPENLFDATYFRSDRVDYNKPFSDWYRTMRASNFEKDLFDKYGIKFTSVAIRDGNMTKFRTAMITVNKDNITVDKFAERGDIVDEDFINKLKAGDVRAINTLERSTISSFDRLDVEFFNDKAARKEIKTMLRAEMPGWHNAAKRFHVRKDIQNMLGVRDWKLFENTRNKAGEKVISMRNKFIIKSLPDTTKSGRIVQCLFGIARCSSGTDVAGPDARAPTADGTTQEGKQLDADGDPNTPDKVPADSGLAEDVAEKAVTEAVGEGAEKGIQETMLAALRQVVSKAAGAAGVVSAVDSLARIDQQIANGSLVKLVSTERGKQYAALFTTGMVGVSQLATGENVTNKEVNGLMPMFGSVTNSEGWATVVSPPSSPTKVSAAAAPTVSKATYCSEKHQRELREDEYHYLCDQYKIGGPSGAATLTRGWNATVGQLHPLFEAYLNSGLGKITELANKLASMVIELIVHGLISTLGLQGTIEDVMHWAMGKAMVLLGAGPILSGNEPSGVIMNGLVQGAAFLGESSARFQGAALTTPASRSLATEQYYAAVSQQQQERSFSDRYFSLNDEDSLASRQLFALSNVRSSQVLSSLATSITNLPGQLMSIFSGRAHAAPVRNPYAAANFAGIETYDFPPECVNSNPLKTTPESVTNADDLGYISADDLNWDLVTSKDAFYQKLYDAINDDEDKAKKVWNCALLDNTVAGSMGAKYGYKGEGAFGTESATMDESNGTPPGKIVTGDTTNIMCQAGTDEGVQDGYDDGKLVKIRICNVQGAKVNSQISKNIDNLLTAAKAAGLSKIGSSSSFRTWDQQVQARKDNNCPNIMEAPSEACDPPTAIPGFSNHQMGLAIDFKGSGGLLSRGDREFIWLKNNAAKYGLQNYPKEAWHWSVGGK